MSKKIILLLIVVGLFFNACKNSRSKDDEQETSTASPNASPADESPILDAEQNERDQLAFKIKDYIITTYLSKNDLRAMEDDQRKFQLHQMDLNNDGKDEIFVDFITSYFCGTGGCIVLLLDENLKLINQFTVIQNLYAASTTQNQWRVLLTKSEGKWRSLIYKNGVYPSNPSVVETTSEPPGVHAERIYDANDIKKSKIYHF